MLLDVIRDKTSDVEVLTTLGADRLKMGIDPDGMVHITDLLTNMYSDEELAVLREYSTNARDSHIAAGCPERPIEVTLPCNPYDIPSEEKGRFLKIKDYGLGLSTEEIAEVYSFYGKSTKDETNEQNGMMGIGGKSGLVSTFGSFTLTAVKDGVKTVVAVGRNEATEPVMDLVSVNETDEPNGVEVMLPAPKHHGLRRKAANLFQFWPEGSVLVDGKAPERLQPKIEVSPTMWVVDGLFSKNQRTDFIVMADVPYPVQLDGKLADGHSLVVFLPTGSVNIAPSREALRLTQKTKDEIARLTAEYDQAVKTVIQRSIEAAKSKAEAVKTALKWKSAFASEADLEVKYRNQKVPMRFDLKSADGKGGITVSEHGSDKLSKHDRQEQIYIGTLVDAVLVHGYDATKFTPQHKRKLEQWAESKGFEPKHYVLTYPRLAHGWIDSTMRVDWDIVKAIKITTARGRDGVIRPRGSYDMWIAGTYETGIPADQIDLSEDIFYMEKDWFNQAGYSYSRRKTRRTHIMERYPNATFVEMTSNRIDKFKRDFPQARHPRAVLTEIYEAFKQEVKKSDLVRLKIDNDGNTRLLTSLDASKITDPSIARAQRALKKPINEDLRQKMNDIRYLLGYMTMDNDPFFNVKWNNPLDKYPLISGANKEHSYIYMNAVYAQEKSKK
jgi:hypothetical protein